MGKVCSKYSKCFKSKTRSLDIYKEDVSNDSKKETPEGLEMKNDFKLPMDPKEINTNTDKIVKLNLDLNVTPKFTGKEDKNIEEEKESTTSNNWDNYFTKEQLQYYEKLYETEEFDRRELRIIQKFKKGELIGEGSFGKVYQGFNEEEGKLIAVKELDIRKLNKKNVMVRLKQLLNIKFTQESTQIDSVDLEIEILYKLRHKNIVKYYGVIRSEEHLHILLEYCIGGSVSKLLETYKKLSESIIRKYTMQILEGLEYLHSHNVIHRDIKGANILVDRDGVCKLSDFGGAKIVEQEVDIKRNSFKGTPNWMAPETVKKLHTTRFSDIWSLGCTIIEMATGQPPFAEFENPVSVLYNIYHMKEPPAIPQNLSPSLQEFIGHCLQIEPAERWNVYRLLRHPFITGDLEGNNDLNRFNSVYSNNFNSNFNSVGFFSNGVTANFTNFGNRDEFENKFVSEDKLNTRLFDTFKFNSAQYAKKSSDEGDKNETALIRTRSPISPINIRMVSRDGNVPLNITPDKMVLSPNMTPGMEMLMNSKRKETTGLKFNYRDWNQVETN